MRRLLFLIYALLFVDEVVLLAVVPLTPIFMDELGLSKVEVGVLLSASSVTTVATSIPIGLLSDRVGARRLTLAAGAILTLSTLGQGLAGNFGTLLASRVGFGLASTTIWTAALAWISDSAPAGRRSSALSAVMVVAGIGGVVGPGFAGVVAEHAGTGVPFVAAAIAAAIVTVGLVASERGGVADHKPQHMLKTFRAARAQGLIVAAFVAMFLGGIADSAVNLLAPLQLDASELSTGSIGIVFSASAAVFIVTSAWVARIGDRAVTLGVVGVSALVLAGSFVPAIVGTDAAPVIASVLARSPFLAVLYTVGLPLGAEAARRAGLGRGAVIGLINVGWGSATAVGPVAAGGLAEAAGERVVYAVVLGACLAVGAWMLASARSASRRPVEAEQS